MILARRLVRLTVALALTIWAFLFRFVDPEGPHGGLTDDHFFYVVRGWQMLFGQLPVRDFVDPGAPLTFALSAAAQWIDRGTVSEMALSASLLAIGAGLTCRVAMEVSHSLWLGLLAGLFQVAMLPRYYNHPKILVYAVAIPCLWAFATRQSFLRLAVIALTTALAFLLRHDHGLFVAIGMATLLLVLRDTPVRARVQYAVTFGALVLVLLAPYFVYLSANGGILFHARTSLSWSERDRERAPFRLPDFTTEPQPPSGDGAPRPRLVRLALANAVPWTLYTLEGLPFLALFILARAPSAFRPDWPEARAKVATLAVLTIALNAGFLRESFDARFADVSVPHAVLGAWLLLACLRLLQTGRWESWRPASQATRVVLPSLVGVAMLGVALPQADVLRLRDAPVTFSEARSVIDRFTPIWPLDGWANPDSPETMALSMYLERCTMADDFVFVTPYLPEVVALAGRPFAGGHGDLRPDFFDTEEHQRLTVARLAGQSVPVAIVSPPEEYQGFRDSLPLVDAHLTGRFRRVGTRTLADGTRVDILVDRNRAVAGTYAPLDLPCFR